MMLERRTALRADPEKQREWHRWSQEKARERARTAKRKPLPRQSERQREFEAELDAMTPLLRQRAGNRCEARIPGVCKDTGRSTPRFHRHHRKRRTQGGTNNLWNLMLVCWACHAYFHVKARLGWARRYGFLVARADHPKLVSVVIPTERPDG